MSITFIYTNIVHLAFGGIEHGIIIINQLTCLTNCDKRIIIPVFKCFTVSNDWILDFYGYERRPKDNTNIQSDEPYIPKVVDVEQENTTETDTHKDEIDQ